MRCIISFILTVAIVLGKVPLPFIPASMVVHAEGDTRTVEIEATNQSISDATTWESCTVNITGSGTVTYSKRITITGEVTLNLGEGVTLKASKGIAVNEGNSLTIEGTGSLQAYSENDAAIGGDNNHSAGSITINSGSITTNNSGRAAGIGGGRGGSAGTITINGGNVNAHGGTQSAGIGGGAASQSGGDPGGGGTIIIRGGQIKATCDTRYASYIGCGIGPGKADGNVLGTEGTISLAWGNNTDYIDAYSYVGTICFEGGKKFFYDGTTEYVTSEGLYQKNKKIVPAIVDNSSLAFAEIRMPRSYVTDNGSEVDVSYEVYDSNDNKLTLGVDYSAVIKNSENTEVSVFNQWGDYTLTVTGMGNYHDSQSYVFSLAEWDKELTEDGSEHYINLPEYQSKTVYLNKNQCIKVYDSEGKDGALKVSDGRLIIHAPEGYALQVTGKTDAMKYNEVQALNINSLSAYEGEDLSYEIISLLTNSENISFASGGSTMFIRLNVASLQPGYTHYGLELNVTVVKAESHSITVADNINGGNIESNKTSAYTNDSVTLTVNPDMGYLLKRITVTDTSTGDTIKTIGEDQWFSGGDTVSLQMMNQDVTLTPEFTNDLTTNGLSTLNFAETGEREYVIPTGVQSFKIAGSPYRNSTTATNISTTIIRAQSGDILQATGNVDFYNTYSDRSKIEIYDGSNISAPLLKIIEGENKDVESIGTVNSSGDSLKFCLYEYGIYNMSFTGIIEVKHRHHFSYSSDGTTITAICDRSDCDLTDNKSTLTLVAPTGDLTYDGTAKAATLSGLDAFNATTCLGITTSDIKYAGKGNAAYAESTEAPTSAGTYTAGITVGGNTASVNYTISPKPVTITGLSIENKTYDGTTTAEVSGSATIEGKVENDDVRVAAGTAAFSDANAGTGKTVTFSGWSLAGAAKDNYTLATQPESVTADISKRSITIKASDQSVELNGEISTATDKVDVIPGDGLVNGNVISEITLSTENSMKSVGDYPGAITASAAKIVSGQTDVTSNYAVTYETGDLVVTKAKAKITTAAVKASGLVYNGSAQNLLASAAVADTGTVQYKLGDGEWIDDTIPSATAPGTYTVSIRAKADNDHTEGDISQLTVTIGKEEAEASITGGDLTKVYGDAGFSIAGTVKKAGENGSWKYASSDTTVAEINETSGVVTIKEAGTTIITAIFESDTTYSETSIILTVDKAETTVIVPVAKEGLTVSDTAQALVTAGKAEGGEMFYALGTDDKTAPAGGWSKDVPTAKDAGTYYVWYKVVGDKNHKDTEAKCVTVIMLKGHTDLKAISISENISVRTGENTQLIVTYSPADATEKTLEWKSSDTDIATVDASGNVKGIKAGYAVVTATAKDGGYTASCKVEVNPAHTDDNAETSWISEEDLKDYKIPEEKKPEYTAESIKIGSKNDSKEVKVSISMNYMDAVTYNGKALTPKTSDEFKFELKLDDILTQAGVSGVKAEEIFKVSFVGKSKDAGEGTFYAKVSLVPKAKSKFKLTKQQEKDLKKIISAVNKVLKNKDNRVKFKINKASIAGLTDLQVYAKLTKDGKLKLNKQDKLTGIKSVKYKKTPADAKYTTLSKKAGYSVEAVDINTLEVSVTGTKNYTGWITVKVSK